MRKKERRRKKDFLNDLTTFCASKGDGDTDVPFVFLFTIAGNIAR